jgi:hypothetical protein
LKVGKRARARVRSALKTKEYSFGERCKERGMFGELARRNADHGQKQNLELARTRCEHVDIIT